MFKQYVITDPCYILDDEEWNDVCEQIDDMYMFENAIAKKLTALTNEPAEVAETKVGDWCNELNQNYMKMDDCDLIQSEFCADAGMVCACLLNDRVRNRLKDSNLNSYAIIEVDSKSDVKFIMDKSGSTTVVRIEVDGCEVFTSKDENDYDDDDWTDDFDFEDDVEMDCD